jgi:hypothetical protein
MELRPLRLSWQSANLGLQDRIGHGIRGREHPLESAWRRRCWLDSEDEYWQGKCSGKKAKVRVTAGGMGQQGEPQMSSGSVQGEEPAMVGPRIATT